MENETHQTREPEWFTRERARRRELVNLLKGGGEIDCLNQGAFLVMASLRLQLMCEGCRDKELATLNKCWPGAKVGEA